MTTIACKNRIMACDSCWSDTNGLHGTSMPKITRLKSGALLGEAGDADSRAVVRLLQSVKSFEQMPSALEIAECCVDYAGVILFPNGEVAHVFIDEVDHGVHYKGGAQLVNRGCTAVGSGAAVAIGAMRAGKSAREAVAIACQVDNASKLPVHTYPLDIVKKLSRKKK